MSRAPTLTDAAVKRLRPRPALYRTADNSGIGLMMECTPSGGKHWRMRYVGPGGKPRMASLGSFPDVNCEAAREAAKAAHALLDSGRDPVIERRREQIRGRVLANATFAAVAEEFCVSRGVRWGTRHATAQRRRVEVDLADLASIPVAEIDAPMVLATLRRIEARGALEIAAKARRIASEVFRYAIATGRAERDPAAPLVGVIQSRPATGRAAVSLHELPEVLAAIARIPSEPVTRRAFVFLTATASRSGETRGATWREVHGERWTIPAARMKMTRDHIVPLSKLAHDAAGERGEPSALLFAGFTAHGGLSENALNQLLIRAGYYQRQTAHGMRSLFSTWAHEVDKAPPDVVELCLAHVIGGVRGTYNRAAYMPQRTGLLNRWATYLEGVGIRALLW